MCNARTPAHALQEAQHHKVATNLNPKTWHVPPQEAQAAQAKAEEEARRHKAAAAAAAERAEAAARARTAAAEARAAEAEARAAAATAAMEDALRQHADEVWHGCAAGVT